MITGKTHLLGIIGYPVAHSLSPVMQNAAIEALGVDYAYVPFAVSPEDLTAAVAGLRAIGVQGFNVTIPHKQSIMPLLAHTSDLAQAVGAVNTVWWTESGWAGTNTDVEGFIAPLRSQAQDWSQVKAIVLGNGGAARAVVAGCAQLGCAQVQVVGRNAEKLQDFARSWENSPISVNLSTHLWEELPRLLPDATLLVNTTPIGMSGHTNASPLTPEDLQHITPKTIAYDLIYTPRPTLFLQQAAAQGATPIDGLEMLVQQGAVGLKQWLQQAVPIDVMQQSLLDYLWQ
ncbi:shikimate dehydrogenase [Egbenema bharatensis]|uniref:shikimate dehydrogenase n=1 Tax=Egbenema bharatensis TaxID=3463334 RepID=UPI003A88B67C